ncbi:hypothetical protein [Chroococcidiopsis sp. SAG 2025]|uniref:hypothetical protein n=1 Tax=Chroococcidiopsis sp. SAG 2025 TaxID=171389 RepID=UPI0029374050|nr:hypothetical protein [Chroococcidiopsis sp. SAG 2025]
MIFTLGRSLSATYPLLGQYIKEKIMQPTISSSNRAPQNNPFLSPGEYYTCHICIPDSNERMAAIMFNKRYYSFFKSVKDREKALSMVAKLQEKGNDALIIKNPKGYSIWVLEPTAYLSRSKQ